MRDCVIDISHHNGRGLNFHKAKSDGIEAVFSKATQGTGYVDPMFTVNQEAVREAGLLFGAYHFGTGNVSGKKQAEYFLRHVSDNTLLALDFEPNPTGPNMTIAQAIEFCETVEEATGKPCVVYTGAPMLPQLTKLNNGERALWWAQYGPVPGKAPKSWKVTLWQYTDSGHVEGIGKCDRNKFDGDDLAEFWGVQPIESVGETIDKPDDPEKGVTTSTKAPSETEGTPPPAPASEVKASRPTWWSRITAISIPTIPAGVMGIFKIFTNIPPQAWYAFGAIFIVAMILGAWLYNESLNRAQRRTDKVMDAAADPNKNNLRLV